MTKLDAGLITSLPAFDPGSAAVWDSKRINPRPQSCLCLALSGYPSNDDDDNDDDELDKTTDVSNLSQLLVYIKYVADERINEEILFFQSLEATSKAADVF